MTFLYGIGQIFVFLKRAGLFVSQYNSQKFRDHPKKICLLISCRFLPFNVFVIKITIT